MNIVVSESKVFSNTVQLLLMDLMIVLWWLGSTVLYAHKQMRCLDPDMNQQFDILQPVCTLKM